jgi:hypothetical protein
LKRIAIAAVVAALFSPALAGTPDAADPQVPVPRTLYRSVFQDTPAGVEEQQDDWKKANAEVAQFPRGHADILKWEQQQRGAARPAATPAAAPARPAASGAHQH